jgi:hypothetical protein
VARTGDLCQVAVVVLQGVVGVVRVVPLVLGHALGARLVAVVLEPHLKLAGLAHETAGDVAAVEVAAEAGRGEVQLLQGLALEPEERRPRESAPEPVCADLRRPVPEIGDAQREGSGTAGMTRCLAQSRR